MTSRINSDDIGRRVARKVLDTYFTTQDYPYTRHHIDSFDQFLSTDLISIFRSMNPIRAFKDRIGDTNKYTYMTEIYVGGIDGTEVQIGSPVVNLDQSSDIRLLFPNEARLRNLSYMSNVQVNISIKFTFTELASNGEFKEQFEEKKMEGVNLFKIPIMLHSRYCQLHGKPKEFLRQAGECPYDSGGYFIIDGSEKVLVSIQEKAFNTIYTEFKPNDPQIRATAYVKCLNSTTRNVENVSFAIWRKNDAIYVTLPMVRAPINVFVLFRALGIQSDEAIVRLIFPDPISADAQFLQDKLIPSIINAYPFLTTKLAIEYIKSVTKGFTVETVLDILRNKFFIHIEESSGARVNYLGECIRTLLKIGYGFEPEIDRDDIRNQRVLTSGFLIQQLFYKTYKKWVKGVQRQISETYNYNKLMFSGMSFMNIFADGQRSKIFLEGLITDAMNSSFKGRWGSAIGDEKHGVLQPLSRLSYLDFMSHCRRLTNTATAHGSQTTGPNKLHPSQFGYFCTNETPSGKSIGITKNLTTLATISTGMQPGPLIEWLFERGGVVICSSINAEEKAFYVPVYINNGIIGYTSDPYPLLKVLKAMKRTGWLPVFVGIGFSYSLRRIFIFCDEGRPLRPLIVIDEDRQFPVTKMAQTKSWRDFLMGTHPRRQKTSLSNSIFEDPLAERQGRPTAEDYLKELEPYRSVLEYIDPYEHNQTLIATYPEHIIAETTHVEIHPSTMLSILTGLIPYANHNQSPRNQLSCSQSKQSVSVYATNFMNRFDNNVHVACYGDAPISRTLYYDYLGEGRMSYGNNAILAIAMFDGYNQDDGFVVNKDSLDRGLFRTATYRSYEFYEEDDEITQMKTRIGNPAKIPGWLDLRPGLDYLKLDDRGIIRVGEYVNDDTVIVGGYTQPEKGKYKDASITPKVWTRGIVDDVTVSVNNKGLRLVKIRVVQDRVPELGDKFSNRHGQKGTIGMIIPGSDMPRSAQGIVPDIIANPHAIPSRMTMAMLLETLLGKTAACHGAVGDATTFMNEGNPADAIGTVLETQYGYERYSNEILYDGRTGKQMECAIFIGPAYYMRLKHMVEDKWNARGAGRKEVKTHQPTGGRGNEGGLKIGEMDRDAIICHGITAFIRESYMERSDGEKFPVCSGCGTIPIYNAKLDIAVCPLCQGPIKFAGNTIDTLEMIPPLTKPSAPIVNVEMPYTVKLLDQELSIGQMALRFISRSRVDKIGRENIIVKPDDNITGTIQLPELKLPEVNIPEIETKVEVNEANLERTAPNLQNLASLAKSVGMTLVPEGSSMAREMNGTMSAEKPQILMESERAPGEPIVEGSTMEEGLEFPEEEVQVLPGAIPPTPELKVLGSKAPLTTPRVVQPQPLMTPEQMASVLVNTAIQQPQMFMAAANQANQAIMPTGPAIIVDTSPRALAADGLLPNPIGQGQGQDTLRVGRRRQRNQPSFNDEEATAPAPAPTRSTGPFIINKLG